MKARLNKKDLIGVIEKISDDLLENAKWLADREWKKIRRVL